jgi:hypothetical protein
VQQLGQQQLHLLLHLLPRAQELGPAAVAGAAGARGGGRRRRRQRRRLPGASGRAGSSRRPGLGPPLHARARPLPPRLVRLPFYAAPPAFPAHLT